MMVLLDACHQEATAVLRRLPGLELAIRSVVPPLEDAVYIDNISNSILVGPKQMTSLHTLLVEACSILDMQVPDMYIRQVRGCVRTTVVETKTVWISGWQHTLSIWMGFSAFFFCPLVCQDKETGINS